MEPLSAISSLIPAPGQALDGTAGHQPERAFDSWLAGQVEQTNTSLVQADAELRSLALGETENLHQVMVALEEARINLELAVQVRNRLVEGYQKLMRMRI